MLFDLLLAATNQIPKKKNKALPLQGLFDKFWDVRKFTGVVHSERQLPPQSNQDEYFGDGVEVDKVLKSRFFWTMMGIVGEVGFLGEYVGRWAEGCVCHSNLLQNGIRVDCQLKGCRAPELASGSAIRHLEQVFTRSRYKFISATASLTATARRDLLADWDFARSKIVSEIAIKLGHWQLLPHVLCGLGHWDPREAARCAERALLLWSRMTPGCSHAMSRRFLDSNWSGLRNYPEEPLRPFLEEVASGVPVQNIPHDGFRRWVASLSFIRVVERPVEGLHSRVSGVLKRAPNSSMSYISNELRFSMLCQMIISNPQALCTSADFLHAVERQVGFRRCVLSVGLKEHFAIFALGV